MAEELKVEVRSGRGTREAKRLRVEGKIPAVLYGHGQESVSLAVCSEQFSAALRHHSRLVDLKGEVNESALIRELQWDTFGVEVLHVDFTRVSADERIEVEVSIELRGVAPGTKENGVIQHLLHEITIECLAISIPEKIQVKLNALNKGDEITAGQIELPEGVTLISDPELVVVQCVEPTAEEDLEPGADGAEPEVIGRKAGDEEEEE
ncbi:MAG: 50S ribosomal protein L25 [Planctomycetota bacterium]|nr:50S ribosomal protein L25 [Planctomycetota bacterium]